MKKHVVAVIVSTAVVLVGCSDGESGSSAQQTSASSTPVSASSSAASVTSAPALEVTPTAAETSAPVSPSATAPAERKPVKVTFIQGVAAEPFYESMACGAKEAAAELGVTLNVQGEQDWDPSLQTPLVNSVVSSKPDAIFIAPNDSKAMVAPLKAAADAGIKVGLVDTTLTDKSFAAFNIATDNKAAGVAAAEALAALIGEKGNVLLVGEQPGVTTAEDRAKGFREGLAKYTGIKYVGNVFTDTGGVSGIAGLVSAEISKTPDLAGVFALSSNQSQGANNAIRSAGKAGKIKVVGFDAGPTQVEQLEQGVVQALVAQQPAEIGKQAVVQAAAAVRGEPVEATIGTASAVVTAENYKDADKAKYLYSASC